MLLKMSLNLHCSAMELWQTPTYITLMCMTPPDEWECVRERYCIWVMAQANGVYNNTEEANARYNECQQHCNTLRECGFTTFYML